MSDTGVPDTLVTPVTDGGEAGLISADSAGDAPACTGPTSCCANPQAPGVGTCGAGANESCCDSIAIQGGTWNRRANPSYPATVKPYKLDKYEVTVGRFQAFMDDNQGTLAHGTYPEHYGAAPGDTVGGWTAAYASNLVSDKSSLATALASDPDNPDGCTYTKADKTLPINNITFYEALLFCAWDGGFLPTEAMWLFEAENGSENRLYPWEPNPTDGGLPSDPTATTASYCQSGSYDNAGNFICGPPNPIPVPVWQIPGSATAHGVFHLAGNVNEMFQDFAGSVPVSDGDGGTVNVAVPMTQPCDANGTTDAGAAQVNGCPNSQSNYMGTDLVRRMSGGGGFDFPNNFCQTDDAGVTSCAFPPDMTLLSTRFRLARVKASFRSSSQGIRCARAAQ